MRIIELTLHPNWILTVVSDDGRKGNFDVSPYLDLEAFEDLKKVSELKNPAASCGASSIPLENKLHIFARLTPEQAPGNALALGFMKVTNGGYFVEWNCGADLSTDTIEAHWKVAGIVSNRAIV